jgi:hypothetical protein
MIKVILEIYDESLSDINHGQVSNDPLTIHVFSRNGMPSFKRQVSQHQTHNSIPPSPY